MILSFKIVRPFIWKLFFFTPGTSNVPWKQCQFMLSWHEHYRSGTALVWGSENRESQRCNFQSKFKVPTTGNTSSVNSSLSLSPKAGEGLYPSWKTVRQRPNSPIFSLFVLVRPPTGWIKRPALGSVLCFTQSADSNVTVIQKHPHRNTSNV